MQEVVPVLKVQYPYLSFPEDLKLLNAPLIAEFLGFKIFASQDGIHIPQPRSFESESYADAEQLVGVRVDKVVVWRGFSYRRHPRASAETLEFGAAVIPED